ncbi:P-loop containing nucleoside triphosphate hydrolase protein, partial [Saccharata proteae CBS 121410]
MQGAVQPQLIPTVRRQQQAQPRITQNQIDLSHAPPMAQGIELIPVRQLPDRFRSIFSFPLFNAVQSKCFSTIYGSDDNFVVSAPTGSGKTVIFELAVLRTMNTYSNGQYKIVYQAPTKSLCSERQRDWQKKFGPLDLTCAELTGDSDTAQLRNVQKASIIITTPEKWDSMTRKWKDQEKLMRMVKLFLIDEVHILKEDRGATLEAVVSRMKSIDSPVRFVAVSATVPNFADIATWLGKDSVNPGLPAVKERFGEEFRPVKLQKHVLGFQGNSNDFAFDTSLSHRLPEVISRYSQRKPIMIFCVTRPSCVKTSKHLAEWWRSKAPREKLWGAPTRQVRLNNRELSECASVGVAYHHAGLDLADRQAVEQGFLSGDISVICCTSTLAVGVNLPCHFVILKNTVAWTSSGMKEYSDIEVIQMLGRAGRPQFDSSGVAVIMTRNEKVRHYDNLSSGKEILESCLHTNLIEYLNAEIGLGTITDISTAMRWLEGTFLYVRLRENPGHYKLGDAGAGNNIEERLHNICNRGLAMLEEYELVRRERKLVSTEFGDAMARYYVRFETMKIFLSIPDHARLSEILSALVQAAEFQDIRFRSGEKPLYKKLNTMPSIKFPIPVNLDAPAHKASLVVQSILGGAELPVDEKGNTHQTQYNTDVMIIFQHAHRLIRCIIDCSLPKEDSITIRNALSLARSLSAKCWDDSPLQLKQLEGIGPVAVRKLVNANIKSIEALEATEPHRIETILSKGPAFGLKLMNMLKAFPKLRVAMKQTKMPSNRNESVKVGIKAEIGFLNEKVPETFNKSPIYVCVLAETSDGKMIFFSRISAKKLADGQDVLFEAELTTVNQVINCYVMCEEIVGTMQQVTLAPKLEPYLAARLKQRSEEVKKSQETDRKPGANISRRRRESENSAHRRSTTGSDDYGYGDLDDSELLAAAGGPSKYEFTHIDDIESEDISTVPQGTKLGDAKRKQVAKASQPDDNSDWQPTRLRNGKWECNHACKNKRTCRHICCREGLDKPPKGPSKAKKA